MYQYHVSIAMAPRKISIESLLDFDWLDFFGSFQRFNLWITSHECYKQAACFPLKIAFQSKHFPCARWPLVNAIDSIACNALNKLLVWSQLFVRFSYEAMSLEHCPHEAKIAASNGILQSYLSFWKWFAEQVNQILFLCSLLSSSFWLLLN